MASTVAKKWIFIIVALASTSGGGFLIKYQDLSFSQRFYFVHPVFQVFLMYLGQFLCIPLSNLFKTDSSTENKGKKDAVPYMFCIPSAFNCVATVLMFYGLSLCAVSICQILLVLLIVCSAVISLIYLKRKISLKEFIGIVIIIIGVALVGIAALTSTKVVKTPTYAIGVVFMILSTVFQSMQYIAEEKLFSIYNIDPLRAIGFEGMAGIFYMCIILLLFQLIPCSPYTVDGYGNGFCTFKVIEDSVFAIDQIFHSWQLSGFAIGYVLDALLIYWSVIAVVKYGSSVISATIAGMRIVITWVISVCIGWEAVLWLEILGVVILLFGSLFYNNVIPFPPLDKPKEPLLETTELK